MSSVTLDPDPCFGGWGPGCDSYHGGLELPPVRFEVEASHAALWRIDGELILVTSLRSPVSMQGGDRLNVHVDTRIEHG